MSDDETAFAIRTSPALWLLVCGAIEDKEKRIGKPKELNVSQWRMSRVYEHCLAQVTPHAQVCLPPSRVRGTTMGAALTYHHMRNFPSNGIMIADTFSKSGQLFDIYKRFAENDAFDWQQQVQAGAKTLQLGESVLTKLSAEAPRGSRGLTLQALHRCLPGDTRVLVGNGVPARLDQVKVGDRVLTHRGHWANVVAVTGFPNEKGDLYEIKAATVDAIRLTHDHKVFTQRGWVKAEELTTSDFVSLPIRPISRTRKEITLPPTPHRRQHGGRQSIGAGASLDLNEEFGFFCGYYLAEGFLKLQHKNQRPCAIQLARHRTEAAYAQRALAAVARVTIFGGTFDRPCSQSSTETIYGAPLMEWMLENFGRTVTKRIPDWVFDAGEDFCRGLVSGYFCGDGSKTPQPNENGRVYSLVQATSVHGSITFQMRDLLASLRIGWGATHWRDRGRYYERDCREAWNLRYAGAPARALRSLMGLPKIETYLRNHGGDVQLWGDHAWLPIRSITRVPCDYVYDLGVDHEDHSFRTTSFSVSNSESAFWPNAGAKSADETNAALEIALAPLPGTSGIEETTPKGAAGAFHHRWQHARWPEFETYWKRWGGQPDDKEFPDNGYLRVFAAWFEFPDYALPLHSQREADDFLATLTPREKRGIRLYGWTPPQIKWRRWAIRSLCLNDERRFDSEFAECPNSCFLNSGSPRFDTEGITVLEIRAQSVPVQHGNLNIAGERVSFQPCANSHDATVTLWEPPRVGCRYLVSVDPASGAQIEGATEGSTDCFSVQVWRAGYVTQNRERMRPRLVARLRPPWRGENGPVAEQIARLARFYGGCLVVVENNMGVGLIDKLRDADVDLYTEQRLDLISGKTTRRVGWNTTADTRAIVVDALGDAVRDQSADIGCPHFVSELRTFVRNAKGRCEAASGRRDDDVLAGGIALATLDHATLMCEEVRQRRPTHDYSHWS